MEHFQKEKPAPQYSKIEEEGVRIKFEVVVPIGHNYSGSSGTGSVPILAFQHDKQVSGEHHRLPKELNRASSVGDIPIPVEKLGPSPQKRTHGRDNGNSSNSPPPPPLPRSLSLISSSQYEPNAQKSCRLPYTPNEEKILLKCITELVQDSPNLNSTDRAHAISQQPFWEGDTSTIVAMYNDRIKGAFSDNSMCFPNRVASSLRNKWRDLRKKIQENPTDLFIRYSNGFSEVEKRTLMELSFKQKRAGRMTESKTGRRADPRLAYHEGSGQATHHHPPGKNEGSQGVFRGGQSWDYHTSFERTRRRQPGDHRDSDSVERRQPGKSSVWSNYQRSRNSHNLNSSYGPRSVDRRSYTHCRWSIDRRDVNSHYDDRPSERRLALETPDCRPPRDREVSVMLDGQGRNSRQDNVSEARSRQNSIQPNVIEMHSNQDSVQSNTLSPPE